ncbi:MAG: methyltransferase domain-containing protein [Pseudomonadota bacterium]
MSDASQEIPNEAQIAYWSSEPSLSWVHYQPVLDRAFEPLTHHLINLAALQSGEHILDVGCGAGALSRRAAGLVGDEGHVTGLDVSPPLLAHARDLAKAAGFKTVDFIEADGQTHDFGGVTFDAAISRFGVMFFEDPARAFSNIRSALKPGGRIAFTAWSSLEDNPLFSLPRRIAIERLGAPEPADPRAPGPLAFADLSYSIPLFEEAGFVEITAEPFQTSLTYARPVRDVAALLTQLGPAKRILREKDGTAEDEAAIAAAIETELAPYVTQGGVHVPAVPLAITARNPS